MITTQKKQTNKQKKKTNKRNRLYDKQTCVCIVIIQGNEKSLMKFADTSRETLKTLKCLTKVLFSIGIMDLFLLPCFCILFKKQLKSFTKSFMSEIVLEFS